MSAPVPATGAPAGGQRPAFRIVGFTGHRQVADPALLAGAIGAALDYLRGIAGGEWVALSSVAGGSDQLFVREALARGLSWHALLPLPPEDFARDFPAAEWKEVEALLRRAGHITVSAGTGAGGGSGERADAYLDCGLATVNGSDLLIAVWDGQVARGKGGTAEVVEYARAIGRPLLIIDAATGERRAGNRAGLDLPQPA